jgi:glutamate-1-semialdehyde 2,1-aminomutase
MDVLAPNGPVYQAGTLSGNPLAMAAGYAMLKAINEDKGLMSRLEEKTKYLHTGITEALNKNNVTHTVNRIGSV